MGIAFNVDGSLARWGLVAALALPGVGCGTASLPPIVEELRAQGYADGDIEVLSNHRAVVQGDMVVRARDTDDTEFRQYEMTNSIGTNVKRISIKIDSSLWSPTYRTALDRAITQWNSVDGLRFTLGKPLLPCNKPSIVIRANGPDDEPPIPGVLARAETPSDGRPGHEIVIYYWPWEDADRQAQILTHEIGHTLGLRHTDWKTRKSCGATGTPENASPLGAEHIDGTPRTEGDPEFSPGDAEDLNSLMNACDGALTLSDYDRIAAAAL